ncbi:peptidoglycan DD-metalloendopeptidase family protein [Pseudomonas sp. GOM6]|uniref:peptidoglycan DD-metalloendopeptidase family protein n=1 Tax=Pseudomonas sp. GOM6 TaxID=3036944 RepID=UPI0024091528|nr:peptidoglycan DD-metalloendopeptidase family protein [Pseudomonas sp. GOM6]MDG1583014.1 peptidoglycan DD-metalloendopeptidase family protein [Pseudomonas sp. GOM6]
MSLTQQRKHHALGAVFFAALLAGCASKPSGPVQVVDRTQSGTQAQRQYQQQVTSGQYRVQRGDTLYSIAFRFGWDWKALAARNNISAPYVIRPGQAIHFGMPPSSASAAVQPTRPATPVTAPVVSSRPPVQSVPATKPATVSKAPVVSSTPPAPGKVESVTRSSKGWAWPSSGVLIGKFSSNGSLNKGIDIAGNLGQPVLAASDGTVVYAGSGLRGYGELVIIKHSDTYVSAYGHNRRLLVREGQQVKVGQHIAEMGSTGTDRVKLHFEIRRQGKPVDPLQYLPRR